MVTGKSDLLESNKCLQFVSSQCKSSRIINLKWKLTVQTSYFFHKGYILYPQEACEAAGDSILDLADYCLRRISLLIAQYVPHIGLSLGNISDVFQIIFVSLCYAPNWIWFFLASFKTSNWFFIDCKTLNPNLQTWWGF